MPPRGRQVMVKRVPGLLLLRVDGKKQSFNVKATNLTHRIHHLSFGHSDDRMNVAARHLLPSLQVRVRVRVRVWVRVRVRARARGSGSG